MVKGLEKFLSYKFYKDLNLQWLGIVPSHWEVTRLGGFFKERRTKVSDKDFPPLSVTKNGILPQLESAAKTNDGDNRKLVKSGDFVINSRSDRKGSSGVSEMDGSVSLINIVLVPRGINRDFCKYFFKSYSFVEEFYRIGHGIVADLWTTRYDEMRSIVLAFPPLSEQANIANFLDCKGAQIDQAIQIKERQIERLKERKQILIQLAVTRGLNPDAPMRDSGIEWIGKIPVHWDLQKVKHLSSFITSGPRGWSDFFSENGAYFLQSGNLNEDMAVEWGSAVRVNPRLGAEGLRTRLRNNDLVVCITGAKTGKAAIAEFFDGREVYINQHLALIRPVEAVVPRYLALTLYSAVGQTYFFLELYGLKQGLGLDDVKNALVVLPPRGEQEKIVAYVDAQSALIARGIELLQQQITKLKEYKATLINSAVTGKIKVPGVVEPAEIEEREIA